MDTLKKYKEYLDLLNEGIVSTDEYNQLKKILFMDQRDAGGFYDEDAFNSYMMSEISKGTNLQSEDIVTHNNLSKNNDTCSNKSGTNCVSEAVKPVAFTKKPFLQRNTLTAEEFEYFKYLYDKRCEELLEIHRNNRKYK